MKSLKVGGAWLMLIVLLAILFSLFSQTNHQQSFLGLENKSNGAMSSYHLENRSGNEHLAEDEGFSNIVVYEQELDNFLKANSMKELFKMKLGPYNKTKHCTLGGIDPSSDSCKCPSGFIEYRKYSIENFQEKKCTPPLCLFVKSFTTWDLADGERLGGYNSPICSAAILLQSSAGCEAYFPEQEIDYCYLTLKQYSGDNKYCAKITSYENRLICEGRDQ